MTTLYKAVEFKAENVDPEKRVISGYASTWDKDLGDDVILRGAFAKSLATRANRVKVLWQHDARSPIGKPQLMREDERGLYVESYIARTRQGDDALTLAQDGIIDVMSIGFMLGDGDAEYRDDGVRVINNLHLLEYSLVTWAMNEAAVITGVKSLQPREIEHILCEAGMSRSQAKRVASAGVAALREADSDHALIADAVKQFQQTITGT